MSIKRRIINLEKAILRDGSEFCDCRPFPAVEIYHADLSEKSNSSVPALTGDAIADACADCGKPIEKQQIIIQLCDATTKDRFPGEWNAREH